MSHWGHITRGSVEDTAKQVEDVIDKFKTFSAWGLSPEMTGFDDLCIDCFAPHSDGQFMQDTLRSPYGISRKSD